MVQSGDQVIKVGFGVLQGNWLWQSPQEILRPTSCLMQVQLEGQIRMIRAFFSQVLKTWEARYLNTAVKGPYFFLVPFPASPFPGWINPCPTTSSWRAGSPALTSAVVSPDFTLVYPGLFWTGDPKTALTLQGRTLHLSLFMAPAFHFTQSGFSGWQPCP